MKGAFSFIYALAAVGFGVLSASAQTVTRSFSAPQAIPLCRIQVTREGGSSAKNLNLGATTKPSVRAVDRNSQLRTNVVQSLVVTSGYPASLDVDGEALQVRCLALPNSFELELTVASRPAVGLVKTLSTTISVQRGQRLEIGGAARDLRKKNREISAGGVGYARGEESGGERVYLVVQ